MVFAARRGCRAHRALAGRTRRLDRSTSCCRSAAFLAGVALLGPFVLTRFDLYAATLTLAAVCAILYRRRTLGPVLLGVAIATKIYPAVLLPLLVARTWRREGRPAALTALGGDRRHVAAHLPSVRGRRARGRRAERLAPARAAAADREPRLGVLLALHHALGMPLGWASGSGSQNLTGTVATVASAADDDRRRCGARARLGALCPRRCRERRAVRALRGRRGRRLRRVRQGRLAAVPDLAARDRRARPGTPGASPRSRCSSSRARSRACWFPSDYWELVKQFDPTASWLVLVRDLVLVAALRRARRQWQARDGRTRSGPGNSNRPDRRRPAARGVALDEHALDPDAARRRPRSAPASPCASAGWRASVLTPITESCGPGHPDVRDRGRAAGLHARVGRLHVRVRADDGGHATVEPAGRARSSRSSPRRGRRRGSTGVVSRSLVDELVDDLPHAPRRLQRERAHHVDRRRPGCRRGRRRR